MILRPKRRRRYVVTTDSDHAGPIFPNLAEAVVSDRPNQLWVADLTYVSIPGGFVSWAAILEAVYLAAYETFEDVTADLPRLSTRSTTTSAYIRPWAISAPRSLRINTTGRRSKQQLKSVHPQGALHSPHQNYTILTDVTGQNWIDFEFLWQPMFAGTLH